MSPLYPCSSLSEIIFVPVLEVFSFYDFIQLYLHFLSKVFNFREDNQFWDRGLFQTGPSKDCTTQCTTESRICHKTTIVNLGKERYMPAAKWLKKKHKRKSLAHLILKKGRRIITADTNPNKIFAFYENSVLNPHSWHIWKSSSFPIS